MSPMLATKVPSSGGAQLRHLPREQVAAVQRQPGAHPGIVAAEFGAEVEPLLQVGPARGEFGTDREVSPPGRAAAGHGDLHLGRLRQREKRGAGRRQPGQQVRRDAVAGDVEEAVLAARRLDLPGHLGQAGGLGR
jgi:hypothetical protein